MQRLKVFISSVQSEFSEERETLYRHIENDPFLKVYFEAILFENYLRLPNWQKKFI